ncbi:hypothetical protein SPI_08908 [Niveomyces insectorum RCEF 264]|uniref:Uncharacterized protein n=1 Tax=Niveomyces insectorum RCEF 264 TaxID=1081102 RepID=A0A167MFJ7_9HYPO|nr:hypothetical protein SPI_08908 [Niveomyces insectorum RCEF 264]
MASFKYSTAEDEKRLLDETTIMTATDAESQTKPDGGNQVETEPRQPRHKKSSSVKRVVRCVLTTLLVVTWCILALGVTSMAVGTWRHHRQPSCGQAGRHRMGAVRPVATVQGMVLASEADAAAAGHNNINNNNNNNPPQEANPSAFARLLEAVSPDALHSLLHQYFPDTYKHGVYPSEKSALEAIHRANAPLATSIVQLARRDSRNSTVSSSPPPSSSAGPTSTLPPSSTSHTTTTTAGNTTGKSTTTAESSKTTPPSSSHKVTSTFTSTINGTPTVVTATSVVGVGAANTGGGSGPSGSLQTNAAVPIGAGGNRARLAEAMAGVLVGALLF